MGRKRSSSVLLLGFLLVWFCLSSTAFLAVRVAKGHGRKSGAVFMRKRKGGESEQAVLEYKQQKKEKIKVSPFMVRFVVVV